MNKPRILWIDLRLRRSGIQIPAVFKERCEIKLVNHSENSGEIGAFKPQALCFDYDYPDPEGLQLLQETKQARPSLPLVMVTQQHSEPLAIWAFRNRVWDYLVRPVSHSEAERTVESLVEILALGPERRNRRFTSATPIPNEARFRSGLPENDIIEQAKTYIQKYLASKIQEQVVAKYCDMSPFRFSRAFKKATGITFQEYVIQQRVKEAVRLMDNPNASITDIAFSVGFNDPSYFARIFKRYMGRSPSEYRESNMQGQPDDSGLWARLELPENKASR